MEFIKLIAIGILLGISNVIPGVSGGTLAVVFGVYDRIIELITINIKKIFSRWKFIVPLLVGLIIGIFAFTNIITTLLQNYRIPTNWFFMGLIAGSIPFIWKKIRNSKKSNISENLTQKQQNNVLVEDDLEDLKQDFFENSTAPIVSTAVSFFVALIIMLIMLFFNPVQNSSPQTVFSLILCIKLLIAGSLAAIAMIIPGISGSFLLLAIGMYSTVITAVANLNIILLIFLTIGIILGLLGGAKLIRFIMSKFYSQTYGAIMGLVIGSITIIFPGIASGIEFAVSILVFIAGFILAYFSCKKED
ncbi:MAG: hypothetical protein BKP49_08815 [Treponema sp. CETP13]|nr:MAG: hypothetical protein BKP49_08815 [Treponema sp. CETP13]